jgi:hypothetical protein
VSQASVDESAKVGPLMLSSEAALPSSEKKIASAHG